MYDDLVENSDPKDKKPWGYKLLLVLICFVSLFSFALYKALHPKPIINPNEAAKVAKQTGSENGTQPGVALAPDSSPAPEQWRYEYRAGIGEDNRKSPMPLAVSTPTAPPKELIAGIEDHKAAGQREGASGTSLNASREWEARRRAARARAMLGEGGVSYIPRRHRYGRSKQTAKSRQGKTVNWKQ